MYFNSTNERLGIFTSTPQTTVDIKGNVRIQGNLQVTNTVTSTATMQYALSMDVTGVATSVLDPNLDSHVTQMLTYMLPPSGSYPYGIQVGTRARVLVTSHATTSTMHRAVKQYAVTTPSVWSTSAFTTTNVVYSDGTW